MPYGSLKFIRPFVKISSTIAPRLTGNFAFKLFCRPPKAKNLDKMDGQLIATAQSRINQTQTERIAIDGEEVQIYRIAATDRASLGTVLLLHGWGGRAASMSGFIEPILEAGFDILSLDLPGHGESTGRELHIPLALTVLSAVHARFGPWHGVVAHSLGGAIALAMAAGTMKHIAPISLSRLVLIATPHSVPALFNWFSQIIGLTGKGSNWLKENVMRLSGHPLERFEGLDQLTRAHVPTLIMHAPDDKEVSYAGAEILAKAGEHVTLKPMPRLGHRRILYAKETAKYAAEFMAS